MKQIVVNIKGRLFIDQGTTGLLALIAVRERWKRGKL